MNSFVIIIFYIYIKLANLVVKYIYYYLSDIENKL